MPEIQFTITGNANDLAAGLQQAQTHTSQIAKDFEAISTGMELVLERAGKMTKFYEQNLEVLKEMRQILILIGSIDQANNSAMTTNLQAARELTSLVLRQGGTVADATKMYGAAASPFNNGLVHNVFAQAQQQQQQTAANAGVHQSNQPNTSLLEEAMKRVRTGNLPPHANEGHSGPMSSWGSAAARQQHVGGAAPRLRGQIGYDPLDPTDARDMMYKNLTGYNNVYKLNKDTGLYSVKRGREEYAALDAYDRGTRQVDSLFGTRGFGGAVGGFVKKQMYGNRRDVQDATSHLIETGDEHAFARAYAGVDTNGRTLEKGTPEALLNRVLTRLDKNLELSNKSIGGVSLAGAAGVLGAGYNLYGLASQAASVGRVATGYAQTQAQGYGTTQYGTSAGNFLDTAWRSGLGLNPFYSFGNAQQAQNNAIGMGYRGSMQQQYENAASMLQQQHGISQSQSAQAISTLQSVGMSPAQTAAMIASVGNTAASSRGGYYNTPAAVQSAVTAQAGAMGWGGSATGGGIAGQLAARFGGNDPILANTGLTGQDLMNSQFGMGIMSQQLGISYNDMYAYREKAMSTRAGANAYVDRYSKTIIGMLSNSVNGKDLMTVTKRSELDLYGPVFMGVLQGMGINVPDPQRAVEYVWQQIRQAKGDFDVKDPGKSNHSNEGHSYSTYSRNSSMLGASNSMPSSSPIAGNQEASAPPSPSSSHPYDSHVALAAAYNGSMVSTSGDGSAGSSAPININLAVSMKGPHAKAMLDLSLDHQQKTTNGTTAPSVTFSRGRLV